MQKHNLYKEKPSKLKRMDIRVSRNIEGKQERIELDMKC
jgi:glutamine amidotransferase PdxT